ncbi:hypothetical protein L6R29_22620 [Myxococcota bacterium]|nr:hypothetical protein [Myxococcota bacterium]
MVNTKETDNQGNGLQDLGWLLLGTVCMALSAGRWNVPLAAWLGPLFVLRYTRSQPILRGYLSALPFVFVGAWVGLYGLIPQPLAMYTATVAFGVLMGMLPYVLDRWLWPRFSGIAATLVLPSSVAGLEYLNAISNPFGTWGASAYSQIASPALLQFSSVFGIWGISFLMFWAAAVAHEAWIHKESRRPPALCLSLWVVCAVFCWGGWRVTTENPRPQTIPAAGVLSPKHKALWSHLSHVLLEGTKAPPNFWQDLYRLGAEVNEDLFARTEAAAISGARIILWPEAAALLPKSKEPAWRDRARLLAHKHKLYLGATLWAVLHEDFSKIPQKKMVENRFLLFTPDGKLGWDYAKRIPVPGVEEAMTAQGQAPLPLIETAYGRIGGAICFDMDFPQMIRSLGQRRADILLVPAGDWKAIAPYHTQMASLRAIENGAALLRVVNNGYSAAYDAKGRLLGGMDAFTTQSHQLAIDLPVRSHHRTLYAFIGDLFAWLCLLGFLVFAFWGFRLSRSTPPHRPADNL